MAKLIPDFISDDCKSNAERRLFTRFRDELLADVTVLHSLAVARHRYKLNSEADFVLLHAGAVLVFEIKGGRVARKDGAWYFTNRYGDMQKRRESPMEQAASVMAALRRSICDHFGAESPQARVAYGSVTFFPDIEFQERSPEWDLRRVYDKNAFARPMAELVSEASEYSRTEMARVTRHAPTKLSPRELTELVTYLRGDFEKLPTLNVTLDEHEQQLIQLAPRQYSVLDQVAKNPRMVIEGSAGTGKTLLAVECARRHAAQGRRVLFVCFNRLLADHLDFYATRHGISKGVSINTLHGHCLSVLRAADLGSSSEISDRELYQEYIPKQIPTALAKLKDFKPWDVLIVDEGQDIAAHPLFINALDPLFAGGFAKGCWMWFEDPRQRILHQGSTTAFDLKPYSPFYFQLNRNWRNTNEIATFTCVSTMTLLPELSGISGPKVKTVLCDGQSDLLKLQLLVTDILKQGARPDQIVLLTAAAEQSALFSSTDSIAGRSLRRFDFRKPTSDDAIRYSSVFRFKGLESKIIVLTDLRDLHSEAGRMAAYVGMSRANSCLYILLSAPVQQQFEENHLNFADLANPSA